MTPSKTMGLRLLTMVVMLAGSSSLAAAADKRGERYALLIGVQGYAPEGGLRSLNFAENDVNELALALQLGGYRPENVRVLTGSRGRDNINLVPLAKNIRGELDYLVHQCKKGDHVLLAFAGHGVQYRKEETMYFCPADADVKDRQTLIDIDDVYKALKDCKADLKLLLVDACRDDPLNQLDRGPSPVFESVTRIPKAPPPGGVFALFACTATQVAIEDPELKHGVFFHYVIEALTGAARYGDAPTEVTFQELETYVKENVSKRAWTRHRMRQWPESRVHGAIGLVPLVKLDYSRDEVKHRRRALALSLRKKFEEANREMSLVAAYQPDRAEVHLQLGRLLYEKDKYAEAIAAYTKALELEPRNAEALTDRGEARFLNEDSEGALEDYNAALEINPRFELAYLRAGVVRHNQKNYDRALTNYNKAIDLNPLDARAWYFRGLVKESQEDYKGALKDYDRAREINPRKNEYRNRLALMQQQLDDPNAAIDNWTKATTVDASDESAYFYRGYAYAAQGRYDDAIQDYSRVLTINPNSDNALYFRGNAYSRRGDTASANSDWGRVQRGSGYYDSARNARDGGSFRNGNLRDMRNGSGGGGRFDGGGRFNGGGFNGGGAGGGGGRRGR